MSIDSRRSQSPPPPKQSSTSPARKDDPKQQALDTIKQWLGAKTDTLEALLGSPEAAKRFGQVLILACLRNPSLLTCDLKSLFLAALYCAQRGLEPGVPDGCALVPYGGKVTPIPQYRALVKQAIETGSVKSAKAILIHANDTVEWEEGQYPKFIHKPAPFGTDRGPVIGAYSRIVLPDGTIEIEPMTLEQIYKRRDSSASWRDSKTRDSTPWAMWEEEMIRKTALKNGLRTIPVAPKLLDLLETDNRLEVGDTVETVVTMDVGAEEEETKPQTKADALADLLAKGDGKPKEMEAESEELAEPEETDTSATIEAEPESTEEPREAPDVEEAKAKLKELYDLAMQKQCVGQALHQFKMNNWNDFLAFPEMLPTLKSFVEQYEAARGRGRK